MALSETSIEWAIQSIYDHSDGDLFPRIAEIAAIADRKSDFAKEIAGKQLTTFTPGPCRRFIVPKDEISYRQATQLDLQDNIILNAVLYEYGAGIEQRRLAHDRVFSYRFQPTSSQGLYLANAWNDFWQQARELSENSSFIYYCDISDFYNQIAHHTVENQLIASNFPNQAIKWIISLLEATTAGVSRGLPVGPHASHLIAEASLIPIDNSLSIAGIQFLRYADDIIVFSNSEKQAKSHLSRIAHTLDKQQRLMLQRHKTQLFTRDSFAAFCDKMVEDRPINDEEEEVLEIVEMYSSGNPYISISFNNISEVDWERLNRFAISDIVEEYLDADQPDFIRLRWFYRRLAQVGHPGAIGVTLDRLEELEPCFASICAYISSLQSIPPERWRDIGAQLIQFLNRSEIKESEYFRLSILSLFSRNTDINHFAELRSLFSLSDPAARREIMLAAKANGAVDWLREFKEDFGAMDYWQKIAYIYCCADLPADEKKYFLNRWTFDRPLESVLVKWAKTS